MKKKITILTPTFNRPNKLARYILYLSLCMKSGKIPLDSVKILILDGSEVNSIKNNFSITKLYEDGLNINLIRKPGYSLTDRILFGAKIIDTEYVLVCGDDDLPDFIGIHQWLQIEDDLNRKTVFAGRFTNIYGFSIFSLISNNAERPYSGFKIQNSNPLLRVSQYALANAFGVTTLAYCIQPTEIFLNFWEDVTNKKINFHHAGLELMIQTYLTSQLSINLSNINIIYRDFSYIGYKTLNEREAPTDDLYPYYGIVAVEKCIDHISYYCKVSYNNAKEIVNEIICINKNIEKSKKNVQSRLENINNKKNEIASEYPQREVIMAWRRTYFSCYPKLLAIKKILILSIPNAIINYIRNLNKIFIN